MGQKVGTGGDAAAVLEMAGYGPEAGPVPKATQLGSGRLVVQPAICVRWRTGRVPQRVAAYE